MSKVLVSRVGSVMTVSINRSERRNAVDDETASLLREAFEEFDTDDSASVAVLSGAGEHFCGGYDLKAFAERGMQYEPTGPGPMGPTRLLLRKPVIAAIEGYAVAGGLELALWCDLRVASDSAIFGVFCRRWGVPLVDGGTVRLSRMIGHSRALDMILTGRAVAAPEALSFGLANRLVPRGGALTSAQDLALQVARFPQGCLRADRASSYHQWGAGLDASLDFEAREGERPILDEARHGAARFAGGLGRSGDFTKI